MIYIHKPSVFECCITTLFCLSGLRVLIVIGNYITVAMVLYLYGNALKCSVFFLDLTPEGSGLLPQNGSSTYSTSSSTNPGIPANTTKPLDKRRPSTEQKQPRIRTVLTEQQLQTLRSVYQTNPRPDALLKEQLCELTGLSPRVIRVWFQNRRCKDKKKAIQAAEAARMQSVQAGGKVSSAEHAKGF